MILKIFRVSGGIGALALAMNACGESRNFHGTPTSEAGEGPGGEGSGAKAGGAGRAGSAGRAGAPTGSGGTGNAQAGEGGELGGGQAGIGGSAAGGHAGGGDGGTGGTSDAGAGGEAPTSGGPLGTVGEPCAPDGIYGCSAHASSHQLICQDGAWASNGTCAPGTLCDTRSGAMTGSCSTVVTGCAGKQSGYEFCDDQNVLACGDDLVTTDTVKTCSGSNPVCLDGGCVACNPGDKRCSGNGVQTCSSTGTWGSAAACGSAVPVCTGAGLCVPPSCANLAATCGPDGTDSCCSSPTVTGDTFNRGNDSQYPATIADFRLDAYEITVGRFRNFVNAFSQNMIAAGAGKNPNDAGDSGWDTSWNTSLPADRTALATAVQCQGMYQTWTANDDNLPMNCLDWYQASAFCAWDKGRLPTEAEWNYAAAGGREQRPYPWGSSAPGFDTALAVYGCYWNGTGSCTGETNIAPVGSISAGKGKWLQFDLAGNLWEWTKDFYGTYPATCTNCSNDTTTSVRVMRGGAFNYDSSTLLTTARNYDSEAHFYIGARCARDL